MAPVAGTTGVPSLVRTRAADRIGAMFDGIARRYDVLNRLLSLQRDQRWRRLAAQLVLAAHPRTVLDVATGTADLPLMLTAFDPRLRVTGIDIAAEMLARGRLKLRRRGADAQVALRQGNALDLPVAAASVDAVTIAFGIRNVADHETALREMHRVLRPAGSVTILEFALPRHPLVRAPYLLYFRRLLPVIGGLISGNVRLLDGVAAGLPEHERWELQRLLLARDPRRARSVAAHLRAAAAQRVGAVPAA